MRRSPGRAGSRRPAAPLLLTFGLYYLFLLLHFRPRGARHADVAAVRVQEELLGPLSRRERWSVVVLVLLALVFIVGVLDEAALHTGATWACSSTPASS